MNRIYRLVWNRALAVVQVAGEFTRTPGSCSRTPLVHTPRRHPLALAIATLMLAGISAPAWSQTCTTTDPSGCGAPGGIGQRPTRSPDGGAGNGTGGDATIWVTNTSEGPGSTAVGGVGGSGSNGIFNPDSSINVTATGGTGGGVGATNNLSASVTGGNGGAGEAAASANAQSIVGAGGGGGGAGGYISQSNSSWSLGSTTTIGGGTGGTGGAAPATAANGMAYNGDPGAGGGGGAGAIIGSGAGNIVLGISGKLRGGNGGLGGYGGYAGSGGGGGDGLLVLGAGAQITVNSGGQISGGAGGNPGANQDGSGERGGYGGGGAGVNLVGAGGSLHNYGSISGGNAGVTGIVGGSPQDGTPGVGVRAWGGESVVDGGAIAGGSSPNAQADSVLFSGGGNVLAIEPGATFTGNIQSISGTTNGGDTLELDGTGSGTIDASLITGFATNIKTNTGTWTLTGTGNTGTEWTIQQGTLAVSSDGNLGDDSNVLTFAGGTLENTASFSTARSIGLATSGGTLQTDADLTISGVITGLGELTKTGAGTLTLSGANNYSGGTTISAGTLQGDTTSLQGSIYDNAALVFNQTADGTYTGSISGTGSMIKTGAGTLTLIGIDILAGGITVSQGVLQGDTDSLQSNITDNATLVIDQNNDGFLIGLISGSGSVVKSGTGSLSFAGNDTYAGGTTLDAGALVLTTDGELGASSGGVVINGGTLQISSPFTTARNVTLNGAGTFEADANLIVSGNITGNGSLIKTGTGVLELTGANNYSGGTTVSAGTLQGNTASLQGNILDNSEVTFVQNSSGIESGVISGSGALTLTTGSTGTLILNGVNTYTGLTTVLSNATLIVGNSVPNDLATVAGDITANGGTLGGYGAVLGSVILSNGGQLTPGVAGALGSLTIGGDLTIGDGSQLNFDFGAPGPNFSTPGESDHVVVHGNLSIGTSTLNVNNLGSMGPGLYELFSWGSSLDITGGGFAPPSGMSLQILTVGREINLVDTLNLTLDEWDANGQAGPGAMGGGSGTWSLFSNTWSDTTGQFVGPMSPAPGFAIFGGASGTVTVDDTNGEVGTTGMQFVSDGYHLTGGAITLVGQNGAAPVLRVSSGDTAIIDNELDGTSGFNKTDGGTLVLTGTNLYTGTTTLSGGYLSVSSDANLGAAANPLDFEGGSLEITGTTFNQTSRSITWGSPGGGFDIDDASNTFTVNQVLTGSGGLLKSGTGTLVLTGANTYSGGTIVDAGTLQGNATSLQGNITNNATVVFAQTSNGSFSGAISGSGQVIKNDGGTLILSGANSYSGGTTVSAGTLQGDTNSLQGNITDNAALAFNQSSNATYGGVISGSGQLIKSGKGTLTLSGANTYTGGTTVSAGTLQGNASSLQGNITNNAAVIFDQTTDATFSSAISGSGSLTKTGAGTLILDGANTYTGGTTISAGMLEVGDISSATASIGGDVDVQSAGTLRGHGTVEGNVTNDGIVWPGGSVGTLTIAGNYTQNADGTLQIDVTPTQSSMLKVTGNASLAGTLDLIFAPGTYNTSKYTLLQAGSVSGTFGTVDGTVPGTIKSQLAYSATAVDLVLANQSVMPLDGSLFGNLMHSMDLASQQDMGSVLDVALLSRDTSCSADRTPSMQNVASACGGGAWAQYTGSNISLGGSDGSNSTTFGLLGGADYAVGDVVHVGLQAGVGQVNGNDKLGGNGRVDDVHGGIYAYANAGPMVLSAVIDAMHNDYHFNRTTGVGTATSTPGGNMQSAAFQAAWPLQLTQWQLTPKVGALYERQTLDGFTETLNSTAFTASNFPVDGTRSRYNALQPYAVMALEHSFVAHGVTYVPEVSLGYRYDTHNAAAPIAQVTAQDGTTFDLPGSAQGRGLGTASARITAQAGASWSLYADYQGFFGSGVRDNALSFGFTKHF